MLIATHLGHFFNYGRCYFIYRSLLMSCISAANPPSSPPCNFLALGGGGGRAPGGSMGKRRRSRGVDSSRHTEQAHLATAPAPTSVAAAAATTAAKRKGTVRGEGEGEGNNGYAAEKRRRGGDGPTRLGWQQRPIAELELEGPGIGPAERAQHADAAGRGGKPQRSGARGIIACFYAETQPPARLAG